jgi:integrase
MTEVANGNHREGSVTLSQLLDEWLAQGLRLGRSPNTLDGYRKKIEHAIRPALGTVRLDKLNARTLDRWYGELAKAGVSPATIVAYHRILSAALRQAERWGWVRESAARRAQPPSVTKATFSVPPPERVRALIDMAAASKAPEMATAITLAALTGLRRGELCGLRWGDIDWEEPAITVLRSIWQTSTGWGDKGPKTHQTRTILLGDHAVQVLSARHERASSIAESCGVRLGHDAYVLSPNPDGKEPLMPDVVTHAFSRICRRMEKAARESGPPRIEAWPYRFHDLRHYTATELFRAGHNARTVADRLGHADAALTLRIYTHDTADQARAAADSLEAGLVGGS